MEAVTENRAYTVKQWEDAARRTDFASLYCLRYILGTRTIRRASGVVAFTNARGRRTVRFVAWDAAGQCHEGNKRLPQYDLDLRDD